MALGVIAVDVDKRLKVVPLYLRANDIGRNDPVAAVVEEPVLEAEGSVVYLSLLPATTHCSWAQRCPCRSSARARRLYNSVAVSDKLGSLLHEIRQQIDEVGVPPLTKGYVSTERLVPFSMATSPP